MEFQTPEEVAEICRVTRRSVYEWIRAGRLKASRAGRRWLIRRGDLEAFLNVPQAVDMSQAIVEVVMPEPVIRASDVARRSGEPKASGKRGVRRR